MTSTLERKKSIKEALKNRETWSVAVEVGTVASFIILAALIGNIMLCLAIYRFRVLRKIQNCFIVALAFSDVLLALLCSSLSLTAAILGRWPFGDTTCQIQGSLIYFFASFSLLTMTLIALNRYIKMVRSVTVYHRIYTKNNVLLSIVACAVFFRVFQPRYDSPLCMRERKH